MASDETDGLKEANQNPWYVLMTLYGEFKGRELSGIEGKNRRLWNAWAGQAISKSSKAKIAKEKNLGFSEELNAWSNFESEIRERFEEQWEVRNKGVDVPELPSPTDRIDLAGVLFSKIIYLDTCVFPSDTDFSRARFKDIAEFRVSSFLGEVRLFRSKFEGSASFDQCTFQGSAFFTRAEFQGETVFAKGVFEQHAKFDDTRFLGPGARFGGARFAREGWFNSATFSGPASFRGATFWHAEFEDATFEGDADFDAVTITREANFQKSRFNGFTYFRGAIFGEKSNQDAFRRANFGDAHFDKPCSFQNARFAERYPVFEGANLHALTNFTAEDSDTNGPFWPSVRAHTPFQPEFHLPKRKTDQPAKEARDSLASIRHNIAKQGLPEAEHFFFRREMHYAARAAKLYQRPPFTAFWALSNYGYGILQPLLILVGIWALGVWTILHIGVPTIAHCPNPLVHSASTSLNFFGFLRGYYPDCAKLLPDMLKTASSIQTFASYVMLFFLGLGLRQRFRLR